MSSQTSFTNTDIPEVSDNINQQNEESEVRSNINVNDESSHDDNEQDIINNEANDIIENEDNIDNNERLNDMPELENMNIIEPGECPDGENCPVHISINNNISPHMIRHDNTIRNHIDEYHPHLNILFNSYYERIRNEMFRNLFLLERENNLFSYIEEKQQEYEKQNTSCKLCKEFYDHDDHLKYHMSCCANACCLSCVKKLKDDYEENPETTCPHCNFNLEYLKSTNLPVKIKSTDKSEECFICCDDMNTSQYNGKVLLECSCKLEICISCAYKSLKDTKYTKMGDVQGIEGLQLPQEYTVKGACPNCRTIPSNKDEILSIYGFLPPRY